MRKNLHRNASTVATITVAVVLACGPASRPPEGPGTDYPCGRWEVSCGNGACCPWAHICGGPNAAGFQRCAPGYCCYDGDPLYGAAEPDAGSSTSNAPVPQHRPRGRE